MNLRENTLEYFKEFTPFFEKMCLVMAQNEGHKGHSWANDCSEAYLLDRAMVQFEDMQTDPDREDYYTNIANYCAMLWLKFSQFKENDQGSEGDTTP